MILKDILLEETTCNGCSNLDRKTQNLLYATFIFANLSYDKCYQDKVHNISSHLFVSLTRWSIPQQKYGHIIYLDGELMCKIPRCIKNVSAL